MQMYSHLLPCYLELKDIRVVKKWYAHVFPSIFYTSCLLSIDPNHHAGPVTLKFGKIQINRKYI